MIFEIPSNSNHSRNSLMIPAMLSLLLPGSRAWTRCCRDQLCPNPAQGGRSRQSCPGRAALVSWDRLGLWPLCPYVTLSTLLLHSCCCCCLFPAPRTGSWGSQNPLPMANQAPLFLPWLLPPLQRDTHSFAVGACHLHAGAQLPRDAASGARGGCARSSWSQAFIHPPFASCFWKIITLSSAAEQEDANPHVQAVVPVDQGLHSCLGEGTEGR